MKNKLLKKETLQKLLIIFMIIQPILDIYYLYTDKVISIFKLSPATIIRMIFMVVLFIIAYINNKQYNKKQGLIIFIIVYTLYAIFHHINAICFNKELMMYPSYSFIKEIFYLIRMIMPLLMIYISKESNLTEDKIKKIIYTVITIFSLTIIITNFLGISLTSYASGNKIIEATFFDWFKKGIYEKYTYELLASKGLFHMANQISATLIALLPIELYYFFKEKLDIKRIITIILNIFAMIMIGTRVASLGWLIVSTLMIVEYIYFSLKKELKFEVSKIALLGIICIGFCILLPYSPVKNRTYAKNNAEKVNENIQKNSIIERKRLCQNTTSITECRLDKIRYIEKYYQMYEFDNTYIIDNYNFHEDADFWIDAFDIPFEVRADHRNLKTLITKRIIKLNGNNWDYLFGISFTRLRNIKIYMENDIYVHLYTVGIFGIILFIFPYLLVCLKVLVNMIKNKDISFIKCTYLSSVALVFMAGMVSGNVFDEWIVTLFLGFICGLLLNTIKNNKKKKILFIASTGGHLEELMQLKELFNVYDYHIITERTKSTISLKNKYPNKINYLAYGTYSTTLKSIIYPFKLLYNTLKSLVLYMIIKPEYIISTGAHTSGPMCLIGHLLGSKIIFIETFANSKTKSKTGSIVYKFADLFIVQWESMLELYPKAVYGGWIF